ncbi:MAG: gluconate 2-dehydrogenase subunit 3 family protein [Gammaproteobacteria bacterium]|nr:gluconate 2-dehydrogenase subunit 3 family protein [Gammaproteobacteria bacterium]
MQISRRLFLAGLAFVASSIGALFFSQRRRYTRPATPETINRRTLDAVVDAIVPADQNAGAIEAGVSEKILNLIQVQSNLQQGYARGLMLLDRHAISNSGRPLDRLDLNERTDVLLSIDHKSAAEREASVFFARVRKDVLRFYYASETGQHALGYKPPAEGYPDYAEPPPRTRGDSS